MFNKFKIVTVILSLTLFLTGSLLWAHGDNHVNKEKKKIDEHWIAPLKEKSRLNPIVYSIESSQRGEKLYIDNCADCHGAKGEGNGPDAEYLESKPSNLRMMAGHHSDGDLAWKIKEGKGDMPGWKEIFTEQEIWDLVNYIQSLKKK